MLAGRIPRTSAIRSVLMYGCLPASAPGSSPSFTRVLVALASVAGLEWLRPPAVARQWPTEWRPRAQRPQRATSPVVAPCERWLSNVCPMHARIAQAHGCGKYGCRRSCCGSPCKGQSVGQRRPSQAAQEPVQGERGHAAPPFSRSARALSSALWPVSIIPEIASRLRERLQSRSNTPEGC